MPKTWKVALYPTDGEFAWTLMADDEPVYDSPESYPDETTCRNEIRELTKTVERRDKKPKKG